MRTPGEHSHRHGEERGLGRRQPCSQGGEKISTDIRCLRCAACGVRLAAKQTAPPSPVSLHLLHGELIIKPIYGCRHWGPGVSGCEEGRAGWRLEPGSAHARQPPSPHCTHFSWEAGSLPSPWLRGEERTLPALSGPRRPRSLLPWAGHVFICSVTSPTWIEHLLCTRRCEGGGEREPSGSSHSGETD